MTGPCNLVAQGACCDEWDAATQAQRDTASAMAANFIFVASGYQFGQCEVTVRPCGDDCNDYSTYWGPSNASTWTPMLTENGTWINCRTGSCACNPCDCCHLCGVNLEWPASGIVEVKIDGLVVDPSEYYIVDEKKLVRQVGCFPSCQNLQAPSTEVGTFEVTFLKGKPLDAAGQAALDILACEFLKACTGGSCRLPARWRSLSREGVSMQAFDDFATLDKGRTGIFEVDSWLAMVNPSGNLYPTFIPKMNGSAKLTRKTWP